MNKVLLSVLFSVFILTGTCFAQAPTAPAAAPAAPSAPTETVKPSHHMRHADLRKAIHKLRSIKEELRKVTHDYGGHKDKAIEGIDAAITELQSAIDYAQSH